MIWLLISPKSLNKAIPPENLGKTISCISVLIFVTLWLKHIFFYDLAWLSPNNPLRFNISMKLAASRAIFKFSCQFSINFPCA